MHVSFVCNEHTDTDAYADADDHAYSNSHTHPHRFLSHNHCLER